MSRWIPVRRDHPWPWGHRRNRNDQQPSAPRINIAKGAAGDGRAVPAAGKHGSPFAEPVQETPSSLDSSPIAKSYAPDWGRAIGPSSPVPDLTHDLMTTKEVMQLLRIKRTSVHKLKKQELLVPIKVLGKTMYRRADVLAYMDSRPNA